MYLFKGVKYDRLDALLKALYLSFNKADNKITKQLIFCENSLKEAKEVDIKVCITPKTDN